MKVKIAVTDANIFIDLYDLGLTNSFFNIDLEINTTSSVLYELDFDQQKILQIYHSVGRLEVHNLQEQDFVEIYNENYPKSLSEADKSVLHVANKINACVLSSDKTLRNYAKNKEIECHGMIWIFDKLVESEILSEKEAAIKLEQLISSNVVFRNNPQLVAEMDKRLKGWNKIND